MRRTYDDTTHCVIERHDARIARRGIAGTVSTLGTMIAWLEVAQGADPSTNPLRDQRANLETTDRALLAALEAVVTGGVGADADAATVDDFPARIVARGDGWAFAIGVDPAAIMTGVANEPEHLAQDFPVSAPAQRNHAGWQMAIALCDDDGTQAIDHEIKARLRRAYAVIDDLAGRGFVLAKKP